MKCQYGDFQTPSSLADEVLSLLKGLNIQPSTILEPTCGQGAFLISAMHAFPDAKQFVGLEVNADHLSLLQKSLPEQKKECVHLIHEDFFRFDWNTLLPRLLDPIFVMGNPPWVTNSDLASLKSHNTPEKNNAKKERGYDAMTGKSNFDISEWIILQSLEWLKGRQGIVAFLCKTSVARKVLLRAWKDHLVISSAKIFKIDAQVHFNVSVDACLLMMEFSGNSSFKACPVFESIHSNVASKSIAYQENMLLSDMALFQARAHLKGSDIAYVWRSGIKHDCSKVMEFEKIDGNYRNGFGDVFALEDTYIYPMLKSSDIGNEKIRYGRKYMVVPQKYVGEETTSMTLIAHKTWAYLEKYKSLFEKRGSAIYKNRPKYSIFGVGDYAFSPWKVAISGFYKKLSFKVIKPYQGRSVVLDDTSYFLACWSEEEALFIARLLNSESAQQFFQSMIFWEDKRPVTIDVLKRLNLHALSVDLGVSSEYLFFSRKRKEEACKTRSGQLSLNLNDFLPFNSASSHHETSLLIA